MKSGWMDFMKSGWISRISRNRPGFHEFHEIVEIREISPQFFVSSFHRFNEFHEIQLDFMKSGRIS
jgi:hypothetical protein